jgi:phytoene desaturase
MKSVGIIGSGFSGLAAACYSAQQGAAVTVFEKNSVTGGRARTFSKDGFVFDMGPSWYWMPDIIERFFNDFNKTSSDYYKLIKLDPAFKIFYKDKDPLVIPSELEELYDLFESVESGSAMRLRKFLREGESKYKLALKDLIYTPGLSWAEYAGINILKGMLTNTVLSPMSVYVRKFFKDERLIRLMEFPVIFLGAMPDKIPALYSLMNYSAFSMGTWYPQGGMGEIPKAMEKLAISLGVDFRTNSDVIKIRSNTSKIESLETKNGNYLFDSIIASGDYHHMEQILEDKSARNYTDSYWNSRVMAPSCLIFYLGINKKLDHLEHHNLFFDTDFDKHASEIYVNPKWPSDPLFYVCCPSKTDSTVAPANSENLFILIPLAPGLEDNQQLRDEYFEKVTLRINNITKTDIRPHIIYKKDYCLNDFKSDYYAFKGNAYGLANTLKQTAVWKPSVKNKKIDNLFYAGQLTVPGPGVPPALISGKIAATQCHNYFKKMNA